MSVLPLDEPLLTSHGQAQIHLLMPHSSILGKKKPYESITNGAAAAEEEMQEVAASLASARNISTDDAVRVVLSVLSFEGKNRRWQGKFSLSVDVMICNSPDQLWHELSRTAVLTTGR